MTGNDETDAEKPTMLSIYHGQEWRGFVMSRGRAGVEAFNSSGNTLGLFKDLKAAANAVSAQGDMS